MSPPSIGISNRNLQQNNPFILLDKVNKFSVNFFPRNTRFKTKGGTRSQFRLATILIQNLLPFCDRQIGGKNKL